MKDLVAEAERFGINAHLGQKRKGTGEDYSVHPLRVGRLLRQHYPDNAELEAAGYLHDTIEDVEWVTYMSLAEQFGVRVAGLVDSVTRRPPGWRGGQAGQHRWSIEDRMAEDSDVARLKAADLLDNLQDSIRGFQQGHDVWSRFAAGERKLGYWTKIAGLVEDSIGHEPLGRLVRSSVAVVGQYISKVNP